MLIRPVTSTDILAWRALSAQYDRFVVQTGADLEKWYGDPPGLGFEGYMAAKIRQGEALMAEDPTGVCAGIVAYSRTHSRITFFAVDLNTDFDDVGAPLLGSALDALGNERIVSINVIRCADMWMDRHRALYVQMGFLPGESCTENGVPVCAYDKPNNILSQ